MRPFTNYGPIIYHFLHIFKKLFTVLYAVHKSNEETKFNRQNQSCIAIGVNEG